MRGRDEKREEGEREGEREGRREGEGREGGREGVWTPKQCNVFSHTHQRAIYPHGKRLSVSHLLFEVPPLLLVHQNQVDIVTNRKLFVYVSHGRREFIATQEQANGNRLSYRMEWRLVWNGMEISIERE